MAITATAKAAAHRRRTRLIERLRLSRAAGRAPIIDLHATHRAPEGVSAGALDVPRDADIADHIAALTQDCPQLLRAGAPDQ